MYDLTARRFLASSRALEVDSVLVNGLQATTRDAASNAVQRGRDHGLPSYNTLRVAFGLPAAT